MIKKLITKLLGKPASDKPYFGKRTEVPASVHGINPKLVDERAINVVRTLQEAGFEAYIVGAPCATCCWACAPKTSISPTAIREAETAKAHRG